MLRLLIFVMPDSIKVEMLVESYTTSADMNMCFDSFLVALTESGCCYPQLVATSASLRAVASCECKVVAFARFLFVVPVPHRLQIKIIVSSPLQEKLSGSALNSHSARMCYANFKPLIKLSKAKSEAFIRHHVFDL